MKTMSKKTIIIIGATSGIGRELFEKYAVDGNCIGIVGRRKNLLDELYKQHPDNTFTSAADITKQEEIEQAIHTLCAKLNNYMEALRKKSFQERWTRNSYRHSSRSRRHSNGKGRRSLLGDAC